MNLIVDALKIAEKYYNQDTFYHAIRVTVNVANDNLIPANKLDDCIILALIHDLIEDTDFCLDDSFYCKFGSHIESCLELLTKDKEDSYEQYLTKIKANYNNYPEAHWVKLADIKVHLTQTETLTDELKEKYLKALPCLL